MAKFPCLLLHVYITCTQSSATSIKYVFICLTHTPNAPRSYKGYVRGYKEKRKHITCTNVSCHKLSLSLQVDFNWSWVCSEIRLGKMQTFMVIGKILQYYGLETCLRGSCCMQSAVNHPETQKGKKNQVSNWVLLLFCWRWYSQISLVLCLLATCASIPQMAQPVLVSSTVMGISKKNVAGWIVGMCLHFAISLAIP